MMRALRFALALVMWVVAYTIAFAFLIGYLGSKLAVIVWRERWFALAAVAVILLLAGCANVEPVAMVEQRRCSCVAKGVAR